MPDTPASQIARINELSTLARTSWIGLLAYLAFVFVTVLGVDDADFFDPNRKVDLPMVNVAIPADSFFLFAPVVSAALYTYLHVLLLKLWDAIAEVDPVVDGRPIADRIDPWLVNDLATFLKGRRAHPWRPLTLLSIAVTALLVWIGGPFVLWWSCLRVMPAHQPLLMAVGIASLGVAMFAGGMSYWRAYSRLAEKSSRRPLVMLGFMFMVGFVGLGSVIWSIIFEVHDRLTYDNAVDNTPSTLKRHFTRIPADLRGAVLVELPADWQPNAVARFTYRERWCSLEGLPMSVCGYGSHWTAVQQAHVSSARRDWCDEIRTVDTVSLSRASDGCMASFQDIEDRFETDWRAYRQRQRDSLPVLDLSGRDMRLAVANNAALIGADLDHARLDDAVLIGANMEGASLRDARLPRARLDRAQLQWADLRGADLNGATLVSAQLSGANLGGGIFGQTSMKGIDLEKADLTDARLARADLADADLRDATLVSVDLSNATLTQAELDGVSATFAGLAHADLAGARLTGADLSGADLRGANLHGVDWRGATTGGPVLGADLRGARNLTQDQLDQMIGDATTLLPDDGRNLTVPSCWSKSPDFFSEMLAGMTERASNGDSADQLRATLLCPDGHTPLRTGTRRASDGQ